MCRKCYAKIENNSQKKPSRSYRFISGLNIMIIKALIMQIYIILHNRGFISIILALFTLNRPLPRKELNLLLEEVRLGLDMKIARLRSVRSF